LEKERLLHQFTVPYTPQQNGAAERKNRSSIEMAQCMLLDAVYITDFGVRRYVPQLICKTDYRADILLKLPINTGMTQNLNSVA
jgi:hypothetical protein